MRTRIDIEGWAFWSPEAKDPLAWREHWQRGGASPGDAAPGAEAVPAMHRRRASKLTKMSVQTAFDASAAGDPDFLVFCSQHGEKPRTDLLLEDIARGIELSPTAFSQSVHNTSAGLYTIIKGVNVPASSLAGGAATFACGWLEAESYLHAHRMQRVLLVCGDDLLPERYRGFSRQTQCSYAAALSLVAARSGGVVLEPAATQNEEALPLAGLFLAWWLSAEPTFRVTAEGQGWCWQR
jgi:Beta-ketoacyl synthase, N-terminal domain